MHIVTLGSGTGQATVLRGLRSYDCEVTAIVGVTDNGGHSGALRRTLKMPQVGDTRQCLGALADEASAWGKLLQHRFADGELQGVSVGNLMLAALSTMHGRFSAAVEEVCQAVGIAQRVLPVSDTEKARPGPSNATCSAMRTGSPLNWRVVASNGCARSVP